MDPVVSPATARPPLAVAALGPSAGCRSQCKRAGTRQRRGQDDRVEEHGAADLPTANQAG